MFKIRSTRYRYIYKSFGRPCAFALQLIKRYTLLFSVLAGSSIATADVLLTGVAIDENQTDVSFSLSGESREEVVGGEIKFGELRFEITHVSVHRLVGAESSREGYTEFAVFSSSYTAQTAKGKPWVAGEAYMQCEKEYNSFLAIYSVSGDRSIALDDPPFYQLTESTEHSDASIIYCFVSKPEER